jgi:hypothetical protein
MKLPVDLTKNGEYGPPTTLAEVDHQRGPTVHICGKEELDFPDEGELTAKFKVVRREEETQHERYTLVLELTEVTKVRKTSVVAPARSLDESADALDKLREESEKE